MSSPRSTGSDRESWLERLWHRSPSNPAEESWLPDRLGRVLTAGVVCVPVTLLLVACLVVVGSVATRLVPYVLPALFTAGIVVLSSHAVRSGSDREELRVVGGWLLVGVVVISGINFWYVFTEFVTGDELGVVAGSAAALTAGGLLGALVGWGNVRARNGVQAAVEARAEREYARRQRETMALLNEMLRHHLLNELQIVRGHADLAREHADAPGADHLDVVETHCADMADTVASIRRTADALTRGDAELRETDLLTVVTDEVASVRESSPEVDIALDAPDGSAVVRADDLLRPAVANLLQNALEHADSDAPTVRVTVERLADSAVVTVADDGPGIDPADRDRVLQPSERGVESDGDGLGLFLARSVVERYGGDIELRDADLGGAAVVVRVPLAD